MHFLIPPGLVAMVSAPGPGVFRRLQITFECLLSYLIGHVCFALKVHSGNYIYLGRKNKVGEYREEEEEEEEVEVVIEGVGEEVVVSRCVDLTPFNTSVVT